MIQVVYDKIVNFCGLTKIPCVIVGSKCDLSIKYVKKKFLLWFVLFFLFSKKGISLEFIYNFFPPPYLSRQVDSTDGERLAKANDCAWIETSAKNGTNISACFAPSSPPFSSFLFSWLRALRLLLSFYYTVSLSLPPSLSSRVSFFPFYRQSL